MNPMIFGAGPASIAPASFSRFSAGTAVSRWHRVTSYAAHCCSPDWFDVDRARFPGLVRCRFAGRSDDSGTQRRPILPGGAPFSGAVPGLHDSRSGNLRPFGPAVETKADATALLLRCRGRVSAMAQLGEFGSDAFGYCVPANGAPVLGASRNTVCLSSLTT